MLRHMLVTGLIVALIYIGLLVVIDRPFVAAAKATEASSVAQVNESKVANKKATFVSTDKEARTIFGLKKSINFAKGYKEVNATWEKLLADKVLMNNVDWSKGNIVVYAYFYDFNNDMTKGSLTIGFDGNDLQLNTNADSVKLPKGSAEHFKYDASTGMAEEDAWNAAYKYQNLIERHTLDSNGQIIASDVIVIK